MVRLAAVSLILALGLGYAIWSFPSNREDTRKLADFSEFYAAGQMVREGAGARLYDLRTQAEFQLRVAPVHAFYLRPPFEALLFVPFTFLSYKAAYAAWVITSFTILAGACRLIVKNTNVLEAMLQYTRGIPVDSGLLLVIFLFFEPTMDCFLIGQDSMLMLLVYTLVFCSLKRGREIDAGAVLACGLFKFHLVLPFVAIFALRRRTLFLLGFAVVALILAAISLLVSSPSALISYPHMFFESGARQLMGFQPEYAANIRGLVYLVGSKKMPTALTGSIVGALSVFLLWTTATTWTDQEFELSFSAAVLATLLTGFHSFVYDLSLLLLPVAIAIGELAKRPNLLRNTPLNAALIVLFVPSVHHFLIVYHVYALMALALVVLFAVMTKSALRPVAIAATIPPVEPKPLR